MKQSGLMGLVVLLLAAGGYLASRWWTPYGPPPPPASAPQQEAPVPRQAMPDLQGLARQAMGDRAPLTPAQAEEERQTIQSQVAAAAESLNSIDAEERIGGAEQLAAYPTGEAEQLLAKAIVTDTEAEVRTAAIQSLLAFKSLSDKTVKVLLQAVEDNAEEVRYSALNTLQALLAKQDRGSARYRAIIAELKRKSQDQRLAKETRRSIKEFIRDQAETGQ